MSDQKSDPTALTTDALERETKRWDETLKRAVEHLRELMDERDRRYTERDEANRRGIDAALVAADAKAETASHNAEKAVTKAETATERRFDSVNEFRKMVEEIVKDLMPRSEAIQRADTNAARIDALESRLDRQEGNRGGIKEGWGYLVGAAGLVATVITVIYAVSR